MSNDEIMNLAKAFMLKENIPFVEPGEVGVKKGSKQEVIFLNPLALEPDSVIDPEDIRLWVDTKTREVSFVFPM